MRIAIIDDNSTVLLMAEAKLKTFGAIKDWDNVYKFLTADDFLREFHSSKDKFDFIICDHNLGPTQMQGFEIINLIQKEDYQGGCVLFTANDTIALGIKMSFKTHVDYIVKNNERGEKDPYFLISKLIDTARDNI